jgi:hypothetical protein
MDNVENPKLHERGEVMNLPSRNMNADGFEDRKNFSAIKELYY